MISEEVINCLGPEEALEVLQMKAPNDNSNFAGLTVYEILILSPPPLSKECILLNSIGAGAKNPFIGNKEEQIIRSMIFSDLAAHKKISNSIKTMPPVLVNIMTDYTPASPSTVEQLQFWQFLRNVPHDDDESIYKQRLGLAKQIFEYCFAIDKGMKEIPEEFITDLNKKIKSAKEKLNWNPVIWAQNFYYKIPDQSDNSAAHEEKNDNTAMPSEALNTPSPKKTNITEVTEEKNNGYEGEKSKFKPR